jgi:hypothetical protein
MTETTTDPRQELEDLRRILAKREGVAGFSANVAAIKARIAELEAEQPEGQ